MHCRLLVAKLFLIVSLAALPLQADLLLSLDARQPGPNPSTEWADLSGMNQPFVGGFDSTLHPGGTNLPIHNLNGGPGGVYGPVYEFGGGGSVHWFESQGADQAKFNFPVPQCSGNPCTVDPNGAMTVVAYFANETFADNTPFYSKGEGTSPHQEITVFRNGFNDEAIMDVGFGNQPGHRAISQALATDDPIKMDLWVFHFDGTGSGHNFEIYYDGSTTNIGSGLSGNDFMSQGSYNGNSNSLHIGSRIGLPSIDKQFFGDIQFVEVYSGTSIDNHNVSGMTPAQYSAYRFANLGQIVSNVDNVPGDFNGDGVINAADYSTWRDNLGAPEDGRLNGNGNGGLVDSTDYDLWKTNFQLGVGTSSSGSAAVPEPSALILLALGSVCRSAGRRRQ